MEPPTNRAPDARPFYALAGLAALVAVALLVPGSRAWILDALVGPLRAQAAPAPGLRQGYSIESVFAWVAYEVIFVRFAFQPDRAFFAALAPALLLGPLLHAVLVARALPAGSVLAYLAAEPLIYLSIALFASLGLAWGRLTRRPMLAPLLWGALALVPTLALFAPQVTGAGLGRAGALLALALASALALAYAFQRWRPSDAFVVVLAVIGAHALDGATTWMVLRDPFGLGFQDFGERNPVSLTLVNLSNGWPYFALKLALPVVLLSMVKQEESEARLRAFLLFAVFVLGFGPGMANLLQVMTG